MSGVFFLPRVEVFPPAGSYTTSASVPRQVKTAAFGTAGVNVSTKQGRLYRLVVVNTSATAYFLQVHDKASAPVATNVPVWERRLAVSGDLDLDFSSLGIGCVNGIGLAISSTAGVLTLAAANDAIAYAQYTSL